VAEKQVRIDLVANDKASDKVRDVADEVEALEDLTPEVEVTADTTDASRALDALETDTEALTRADQEVVLKGKVSDAQAALKALRTDLEQTGKEAQRAEHAVDDIGRAQGPRLAGNTVADLTGPLGEASGVASDLGGVFDGLGDTAEGAWIKMGGSEAGGAAIGGALAGVGFAVAGVAAAWSFFRQQQKKAEEQQKKLLEGQKKLNDAYAKGDVAEWGQTFIDTYKDAADAAADAGVPLEELVRFVDGQAKTIPSAERAWAQYEDQLAAVTPLEEAQMTVAEKAQVGRARAALEQRDIMLKARDDYVKNNGLLDDQADAATKAGEAHGKLADNVDLVTRREEAQERATDRLTDSMDRLQGSLNMERTLLDFTEDFDAAMKATAEGTALTGDEILDLKQDVIDVAEFAGLNPVEVKSLLESVENGDYLYVRDTVNAYSERYPVSVNTDLLDPPITEWANRSAAAMRKALAGYNIYGGGGGATSSGRSSSATSVVNVTQHVPRGYRGDLLADAAAAARRSGGLYHRNRR